ncbi:uncharacterized protein METZ01_LOCUS198715 [marine metagenome]|uniref:Uncharacterized protein n=1 Tax=marine metagenome TaxID=408172 RepID=A0A382E792_9ZZZZ
MIEKILSRVIGNINIKISIVIIISSSHSQTFSGGVEDPSCSGYVRKSTCTFNVASNSSIPFQYSDSSVPKTTTLSAYISLTLLERLVIRLKEELEATLANHSLMN